LNLPSPVQATGLAGTLIGAAAITGLVAGIELNREPHADIWSNAWLTASVILAAVAVAVVVAYFLASMFIREESAHDAEARTAPAIEAQTREPALIPRERVATASGGQTVIVPGGQAGSTVVRSIRTLSGHSRKVIGLAFSPDGTLLATCSADYTARLWHIGTGKVVRRLIGHTSEINGVAFSPDGSFLATGSDDDTARLWDVATGKVVRTFTGHTDMVLGVAISPDGALLATGSYDKTAGLWDIATGKLVRTLTGHTDHVWAVAFSPDGALLATGSYDRTARLWDPITGEGVRTFIGHEDVIYGTGFSPDGALLATGSDDRTARVWDVATGELTGTLTGHEGRVFGVAFSPDGALLATSSEDKTARLWGSEPLLDPTRPAEPDGTAEAAEAVTQANPATAPGTAAPLPITTVRDRWQHTSDGAKVPSLMRMTSTNLFHPALGSRQLQETPPSVKVGMLVGCQQIDLGISGTSLRSKFIGFLGSPAVTTFVQSLTNVDPGATWKSMAGNGSRALEAALTISADPLAEVPVALALFVPPRGNESHYGSDGRSATLVLYVEPQTADGQTPSASSLTTWSRRFSQALTVPGAFVDFLNGDLGATTTNDPPVQCGVWLQSQYQPLTVMVDIEGLRVLPGRSPSNQFTGWTMAAPGGKPAIEVSRDLIVQLCEYELHLDDFERAVSDQAG
jgi:hypothetical protein